VSDRAGFAGPDRTRLVGVILELQHANADAAAQLIPPPVVPGGVRLSDSRRQAACSG
jgi:hypothetical protein